MRLTNSRTVSTGLIDDYVAVKRQVGKLKHALPAVFEPGFQAGDLDLALAGAARPEQYFNHQNHPGDGEAVAQEFVVALEARGLADDVVRRGDLRDRKSTRLNSS